MVFMDLLETTKVFPTNFISDILSANIYAKSYSHSCQKQNHESVSYIMKESVHKTFPLPTFPLYRI